MRLLVIVLLCIPGVCFSQQKPNKGYFSFAAGFNFIKNADPVIGGHLSGNGEVGKGAYIGGELGFVKFQGMEGLYIPALLKFTMIPHKDKFSPMIVIAPGYGVYNHTVRVGSGNSSYALSTKGGFTAFAGIGFATKPIGKGRAFLNVGYSTFGFDVNGIKSNSEGVGVRVGVMRM